MPCVGESASPFTALGKKKGVPRTGALAAIRRNVSVRLSQIEVLFIPRFSMSAAGHASSYGNGVSSADRPSINSALQVQSGWGMP